MGPNRIHSISLRKGPYTRGPWLIPPIGALQRKVTFAYELGLICTKKVVNNCHGWKEGFHLLPGGGCQVSFNMKERAHSIYRERTEQGKEEKKKEEEE